MLQSDAILDDRHSATAEAFGEAVRKAVLAGPEADAAFRVGEMLAPWLQRTDLLAPWQCAPCDSSYMRHLVYADPDRRFSVWSLVWAPGQFSPIHDHHCWCTLGVKQGVLTETSYQEPVPGRPEAGGSVACAPGAVRALPAGEKGIHRVANSGERTAISIHVYGFDPERHPSSSGRIWD